MTRDCFSDPGPAPPGTGKNSVGSQALHLVFLLSGWDEVDANRILIDASDGDHNRALAKQAHKFYKHSSS
jgi:hypothetical protein